MGRLAHNLTGKRFGRLVVLERIGIRNNNLHWLCICDCGRRTEVSGSNLRGKTKSCGCLAMEIRTTHKLSKHPLYMTWFNIIRRCGSNKYGEGYIDTKVHPDWKKSVEKFIEWVEINLGDKPSINHSIDRIENLGDYVPGNLRWATKEEQSNNRRSVNLYVYKGETNTIRYFSNKYHVNFNTIRTRLYKGWSIDLAIETPTGAKI